MTIAITNSRNNYTGDGLQTTFAYLYPIIVDADMTVYLDDVLQGAGYVVTGAGVPAGGTVVFAAAPAVAVKVTLARAVDAQQNVDYTEYDAFPANTHEAALDKLTMLVQQVEDDTARAIAAPLSDDGTTNFHLPAYDAGKGLMWDPTTKILTTGSPTYVDFTSIAVTGGTMSGVAITGGTVSSLTTDLAIADGGTGASTAGAARTNLGLDSMATQSAAAVAITGGTVAGAAVSGGTATSVAVAGGSSTGVAFTTPTFADSTNIIETVHTANATHTFNTRAKHAFVEVWGAGGSGSANNVGGQLASSGGGGGFSSRMLTIPAATATIVVGAGGVGVAANANGNTGGTSSYADGTYTLSATGGAGGNQVANVSGGVGSGGYTNLWGGSGLQANNYIGGAGGAAPGLSNHNLSYGAGSVGVEVGSSGAGGPGLVRITEYVI